MSDNQAANIASYVKRLRLYGGVPPAIQREVATLLESLEAKLSSLLGTASVTERSARRDGATGTEMAGAENGHQFRRGWRECCPECGVWVDAHIVADGPVRHLQLTRTNEPPDLQEAWLKRRALKSGL